MDKLNLFSKAARLRREIARLRADVHDLEGFERGLGRLHREYADVFASKEKFLGLPSDISDARAHFRIEEVTAAIDATSVELDCFDLRLLLAVTNACLASSKGSGFLREDFKRLNPILEEWMKEAITAVSVRKVSRITVSGIDALSLRDALESALVDTSALRAYDDQLMRQGDAGRGGFVVGKAVIQKILNDFHPPKDRALLTPDATEFRARLTEALSSATKLAFVAVDINAGKLHSLVAGHPSPTHRIPICCKSMRLAMLPGDKVISQPEDGAWLTIRYRLPRRA